MKRTLDLAITMGRIDELCEMHEKRTKEMEGEVAQAVQGNDTAEFANTISNLINIRKKGRKPKNSNNINAHCKDKGKKRVRFDVEDKENTNNEVCEELLNKKF